jgi:hypothetical protein
VDTALVVVALVAGAAGLVVVLAYLLGPWR